jgi:alkylation response protein AidB-like acyl-CoA dehydrogenase
MDLNPTEEERALRDAMRAYADGLCWEDIEAIRRETRDLETHDISPTFQRALAGMGYIGASWPQPYGKGEPPVARFLLQEELEVNGLPGNGVTQLEAAGEMILQSENEGLIATLLPQIAAGTCIIANGLSEPEAGSDLFNLRTSAIRDGDSYVVNGSKLWTSGGHIADWIATLVRTDPGAKGPAGLSLLLIDSSSPGVEVQRIETMAGYRVNACFFDDARVPVANLIGAENEGARVLGRWTEQVRGASYGGTRTRLLANRLIHRLGGEAAPLGESDLVTLGAMIADLEVDRLLYLRVATMAARGEDTLGAACMNKVFSSELSQRFAEWAVDCMAPGSMYVDDEDDGDERHQLAADIEHQLRNATVASIEGGTNEVQRNMIARALGLPRGA